MQQDERKLRRVHAARNFRLHVKVHEALWQLADRECVSRGAVISRLILDEYRRVFEREPDDKRERRRAGLE